MAFKYSFRDYDKSNMARVVGLDLPISTKHSIEICSHLRKKDFQRAKVILESVISMKAPIPFKRFNGDVGHKPGIGPGRYPVKASSEILVLLNSVEASAQSKGLNTGNLRFVHISAHMASRPVKPGRHRGRVMKRSIVEIVVKESEAESKKAAKAAPKATPKKTVAGSASKDDAKKEPVIKDIGEKEKQAVARSPGHSSDDLVKTGQVADKRSVDVKSPDKADVAGVGSEKSEKKPEPEMKIERDKKEDIHKSAGPKKKIVSGAK